MKLKLIKFNYLNNNKSFYDCVICNKQKNKKNYLPINAKKLKHKSKIINNKNSYF